MSTYAVFGMTATRARENAKRQVDSYNAVARRQKTLDELRTDIAKAAAEIMASSRIVQVSDTYDAPSFADQFLEMAKTEPHRNLHVRAHSFTGEIDPKTKKPISKWVEVGTDEEKVILARLKAGTLL